MKCKKGFKKVDGKCKVSSFKKPKKITNKWKVIILFSSFSLVLFINNVTDLFIKFGLFVPVQWVAWVGLILTVIYNMWLASEGKL